MRRGSCSRTYTIYRVIMTIAKCHIVRSTVAKAIVKRSIMYKIDRRCQNVTFLHFFYTLRALCNIFCSDCILLLVYSIASADKIRILF